MKPSFWMTAEETERELASRQIRGGDMALNRAEQEWPDDEEGDYAEELQDWRQVHTVA